MYIILAEILEGAGGRGNFCVQKNGSLGGGGRIYIVCEISSMVGV